MRIIAGAAKGRRLKTPKAGTRPMTGRARESLFSILGGRLAEARILDLYAGSGSLGLEALSRGASGVVFVEKDRAASVVLSENVERVGLGGRVRTSDVRSFLRSEYAQYDVVFLDPPYRDDDAEVFSVLELVDGVLAPGGIVVLHRQERNVVDPPEFLRSVDERRYGDAVVTMMERENE
ncbi:MAG: 16S rRNA (guanine(966)-N(2))-methyltransferase RsmD [Actinomycetota bacterium]|nr:16S rRNA (guanine(966)-N(2))-methyltransferase RsmD [Actinomycetota bacterium]MDK1017514.1 16S rRNA (guanine(966)-N(2))-methyltransferase RsmD [Actinomycetota bacterium]MDK1027371.1 16S rRNA (guanine(966)-N(2))-methyltransferase RsmD [Actinomycetota bacterium]MDK1037375.1 16S rRNA (guanine(966)-N(2))-methyltransferase RsmD [Actinomycetota bacterium]MDK1097246.1 16S rRNA (guanine(966)-N(2))-methyltransferase RsmD [Actinomycetota bacterium]